MPKKDTTTMSSTNATDQKRFKAWWDWWMEWPASLAKKELQTAFFAGYDAAIKTEQGPTERDKQCGAVWGATDDA